MKDIKKLIETIERQDTWDTDEFKELLKIAGIDLTAAPYIVDGEPQKTPDEIFEEAKTKVLGGMENEQ